MRIANDQAVKVLWKHELKISDEEASTILNFLYRLAEKTAFDDLVLAYEKVPLGEIEPKKR